MSQSRKFMIAAIRQYLDKLFDFVQSIGYNGYDDYIVYDIFKIPEDKWYVYDNYPSQYSGSTDLTAAYSWLQTELKPAVNSLKKSVPNSNQYALLGDKDFRKELSKFKKVWAKRVKKCDPRK